jgi:type I restriction enzyme M protein
VRGGRRGLGVARRVHELNEVTGGRRCGKTAVRMAATTDIVQKLWSLCNVLRDDGITYHQYVTELSYLVFLKMAKETGAEAELPAGYRWDDLGAKEGAEALTFYTHLLGHLGSGGSSRVQARVQAIFTGATTKLRDPKHLRRLVLGIDKLDWYSARREGLGAMYEGLLAKNASETKAGAGQYFTPRELIESIVSLVKPKAGERIQDPAAGTGGFLIVADRYIKSATDNLKSLPEPLRLFQRREALCGMELVPDVQRLLLMNGMLHDIEGDLLLGDALSPAGATLPKADVILTNPPFGAKKGGAEAARGDFTFATSNKQLAFLQHIYRGLKPLGRAAVVVPDNVLFEEGVGQKVRGELMDWCDLHTILRLPTGIFYSQAVKTNVLFFTRGEGDSGNTEAVWLYDMRAGMPSFGKRTPLTRAHFEAFERAFGQDPRGKSERADEGHEGRLRRFSREEIARRGDNLDIAWRTDGRAREGDGEAPPDPEALAAEVLGQLRAAVEEMEALQAMLGPARPKRRS